MPASGQKALKTKTDNCRDCKRAASIQNWVKKPWVKQYLQKAANVHLKKYHDTVGALRKRQTELHKEVKEKKKDNFLLRRDVFVHTVVGALNMHLSVQATHKAPEYIAQASSIRYHGNEKLQQPPTWQHRNPPRSYAT